MMLISGFKLVTLSTIFLHVLCKKPLAFIQFFFLKKKKKKAFAEKMSNIHFLLSSEDVYAE